MTLLIVLVLSLGFWSRFLTNNFVDTDVLICGSNVTGVVVVSKSFLYSRSLAGVSIVGRTDLCGWLGDAW